MKVSQGHWKNRPDEKKPFFAIFNFTTSHESQIRNDLTTGPRPSKVRVPAYHPDHPEVRKGWSSKPIRSPRWTHKSADSRKSRMPVWKKTQSSFTSGITDPVCQSKRSPSFPNSVPLNVHVPEKWKHLAGSDYKIGGSSDRRVQFIDLAPTLLSIGKKPPSHMQGHAFMGKQAPARNMDSVSGSMDERYDMVRSVLGSYIYIRNYMPHKRYGQHVGYVRHHYYAE